MLFRKSFQFSQHTQSFTASSKPRKSTTPRPRNPMCRHHPMPVPKVLIGQGTTATGCVVDIYACPVCNHREGWGIDRQSGRPCQVFQHFGR